MFTSLSTRAGAPNRSRQPFADRIEVPARHDRRGHGPAGGELDRAGQADTDARARLRAGAPGLEEQAIERLLEPGEHDLGAVGDGDVVDILGQHLARPGR